MSSLAAVLFSRSSRVASRLCNAAGVRACGDVTADEGALPCAIGAGWGALASATTGQRKGGEGASASATAGQVAVSE